MWPGLPLLTTLSVFMAFFMFRCMEQVDPINLRLLESTVVVEQTLVVPLEPLTLNFDRAIQPFLKIDMRHEAYRHGKHISDMT